MYRELRPAEVQTLRREAGLAPQVDAAVSPVDTATRAGIRVPTRPGRPARAMRNKTRPKITLKEAARAEVDARRPAGRSTPRPAHKPAASRTRAPAGRPKPRKR
jgi:hypothetical protein